MGVNDMKIFLQMKSKVSLRTEKIILKSGETPCDDQTFISLLSAVYTYFYRL